MTISITCDNDDFFSKLACRRHCIIVGFRETFKYVLIEQTMITGFGKNIYSFRNVFIRV